MQPKSSLKRQFLKKWMMGLERCKPSKEKMSLLERKNAVKLSADLAMATTRKNINNNGTKSSWTRALISKVSNDCENGSLAKRILGPDHTKFLLQDQPNARRRVMMIRGYNINYKRKIVRKVKNYGPRKCGPSDYYYYNYNSNNNNKKKKVTRARSVAERLVKKRTQILRGLVPGGEEMDEYGLIKEALDYIVSLRAQVDVMSHLANSAQLFSNYHK